LKRGINYKMPENGRSIQSGPSGRAARRPPPEPEPVDLAILYQDEHLIAVDKPPGMVVHPTYKNWSGTLLNALLWHLRQPATRHGNTQGGGARGHAEPRIITRLDKETSGIVLVALTADIHARIQRAAAAGRVSKEYLAVVYGTPEPSQGSIALPLARSIVDRRRMVVDPSGQDSRTDYEVLYSSGSVSLVRCVLATGRTHQIRVHLAARGWPIVGDGVYGELHEAMTRQALHAWRVTLLHPISRQVVELTAPPPRDLCGLLPVGEVLTRPIPAG
jgi:23S rRNA pseudouridine1911/1915/1917 synthase